MSSAFGFYRSFLTRFSPGECDVKSNSVHCICGTELVSDELHSLTFNPLSASVPGRFTDDYLDDSENANFANSVFETNQFRWEISAHTESASDRESSSILPELVLTDSSFRSSEEHLNEAQESRRCKSNDSQNSTQSQFLEIHPREIHHRSSQSTSKIDRSFQSTSKIDPSYQSTSQMDRSYQSTSQMNRSYQSTSKIDPSTQSTSKIDRSSESLLKIDGSRGCDEVQSRVSHLCVDQRFDHHQRVKAAAIQVQLELSQIEASRRAMQSSESNVQNNTPRCSVKEKFNSAFSQLGRAFYHCYNRKQSKKELELLRKMRENCTKTQSGPMESTTSTSYHHRRNTLMRKKIEGMINASMDPPMDKSRLDRDDLHLDLKGVQNTNSGCLPTSGRRYRRFNKSHSISEHHPMMNKNGSGSRN
eukprot:g7438.t1